MADFRHSYNNDYVNLDVVTQENAPAFGRGIFLGDLSLDVDVEVVDDGNGYSDTSNDGENEWRFIQCREFVCDPGQAEQSYRAQQEDRVSFDFVPKVRHVSLHFTPP